MFSVQTITEDSPLLDAVKQLWRRHSDTLGFLPSGAFDDYARSRHILIATKNECLAGYILYRVGKTYATIAHFCVAPEYRRRGISRLMLDELRKSTKRCFGIRLNCRRDFDAHEMWPRLGFRAINNAKGKAARGSELVQWLLHYGKPDLFSFVEESSAYDVAIDANVAFHLIDGTDEESLGLTADWLKTQMRLCCTQELCNEIERHPDPNHRNQRRQQIQHFQMLPITPDTYQQAEQTLRPLFGQQSGQQDESDFRQLVCSLAGNARAFITLDREILSKADGIFQVCGLPVVRPAEMIGRIDEIEREWEYQRNFICGTKQIAMRRISAVDDALVAIIKTPDEKTRKLSASMNQLISNPHQSQCRTVSDKDGKVAACYVVERDDRVDAIPVLRVCANRMAGTIARAVLTTIIRDAVANDSHSVIVRDPSLDSTLYSACTDLGFLPTDGGLVKVIVRGMATVAEIPALLFHEAKSIDGLKALLPMANCDAGIASQIEHFIWPGKLADACIPSFIVPIQPEWAEHLFDSKLAASRLFGADVDLALNPESAYYRTATRKILTCPARVLWYVSHDRGYPGTKAIRACSRIVELMVGPPRQLFNRFRRLGVYRFHDVLETAGGDENQDIMAFRFDDTEVLDAIPLSHVKSILCTHGVGDNNMVGPFAIPPQVFGALYASPVDSSSIR